MPDLVPLGRVNNPALFIAVDAGSGSFWGGDNDDPDDDSSDAYRASEAVLDSDSVLVRASDAFQPTCASVTIGDAKAIVMKIGTGGVLEVYRHGTRVLIVEGSYYTGEKVSRPTTSGMPIAVPTAPAFAQYVTAPNGDDAVKAGLIDVTSGWLLLLPTISAGGAARELVATANTDAVAFQTQAMKDNGDLNGLLIKVTPGKYEVAVEPEVDLDFGLVARAMIELA